MAKGLGKGLDALFGETEAAYEQAFEHRSAFGYTEEEAKNASDMELDKITANPNQPRKNFDEQALKELAESIRQHGVIMPIVVNDNGDGTYMIIAGERRFRASKLAGQKTIPVVIRKYNEREIKEISLIENLQREDLNPIEAATAMKQLMNDYKLTQDELAERIGKSRPAIANTLRLLNLCPEVISLVAEGKLSAGHARTIVLLPPPQQIEFANDAVKNQTSVRELEKKVRAYSIPPEVLEEKKTKKRALASVELKHLIERMRFTFRTKISLIGTDKKGRIYIDYYSRDDLDRISEILDIVDKQS
ncbi:MAG: ParB/RepB/Spo0J family partition protein [Clostridia bacterium]|nr:ParB/RepB/Spo0J family partition protein [Clostridia bacterium]MDE6869029.1 ParB/RepB/Spo0J family partition protein [Clostridia bacterium]MDE7265599.1 ParB/RepB/Spo0J family partition protein [Clostridia bacterium]